MHSLLGRKILGICVIYIAVKNAIISTESLAMQAFTALALRFCDTARHGINLRGGSIMNLGEKIRQLRVERRMTQEQLAEKLYVSFQTVSKWETGGSLR